MRRDTIFRHTIFFHSTYFQRIAIVIWFFLMNFKAGSQSVDILIDNLSRVSTAEDSINLLLEIAKIYYSGEEAMNYSQKALKLSKNQQNQLK